MNKQFNKIPLTISNSILTIGPDYRNHRGGIGAVLEVYSKYFENFKFLATYNVGSVLFKSFYFFYFLLLFFSRLVFDPSIRIVHIHGASRGSFARKFICFLFAKYVFKKKIIYHIHGAEYHLFYNESNRFVKRLVSNLIDNSDTIVCLSNAWKDFFKANFNPKRIVIVANVIDNPCITSENEEIDTVKFLFLGQIGKRKGIFDLLQVIIANREKYKGKVKIVIGGNGEIDRLHKTILEQGLTELVEFKGWVSNEEKIKCLQEANIYVLPSYNEGLPISVLEAMSYGKAIISSNVGGISEIVIPEKNGILVEPGNLDEIGKAIDYFIENPHKINTFGDESKKIAIKHLPYSVMPELTAIYTQLLYE